MAPRTAGTLEDLALELVEMGKKSRELEQNLKVITEDRDHWFAQTSIYREALERMDPGPGAALLTIASFGGIDGEHHKQWVLDQVVRNLTGDAYEAWVKEQRDGEDGPHTYDWSEGIAP